MSIFQCYVNAGGVDVIDIWYEAASPRVQAKFDSRRKFLNETPRSKWARPHFSGLNGACSGLSEIRFDADKVQHRPIGFQHGEKFVIVLVAIEKGGKFHPKDACNTAQDRKKEVLKDGGRACDCGFD